MADIEKFVYYDNGSKKVLKPTDRIVIGPGESDGNGGYLGGLAFEGATNNDFETTLKVEDPTADRTITFPDEDGDIALLQGDALPKALSFPVKNPSETTLYKGQLVYISGYSGNNPEVSLAKSDHSSTMPAFGFVQKDIAAGAEGYVVYSGLFKGIDTNTNYSEGDTLYVSSTTEGGFQNFPPTGSNLIQNIGKIIKSDSTNGEVLVGGAGRTNATPNLSEGKFFIGNASNQSSESSYQLPTSIGTPNQVLASDGTNITFQNPGLLNIVEDTTPQLGGTLDLNSQTIQGDLIPSAADTYNLGSVNAEWSNIFLGDDSEIQFGLGQDVIVKHIHNAGLRVEMSSAQVANSEPNFTLYSTLETGFTTGPKLSLQSKFVDNSEVIGGLDFKAGDFTTPVVYAESNAQIKSNSSSLEEGKYDVKVICSGLLQTGLSIEPLNNSSTPSVKISDNYYLPANDGTAGQFIQTNGSGELTFADATSGYTEVTASISEADFVLQDMMIPTDASSGIIINLPTTKNQFTKSMSYDGDRFVVDNKSTQIVKLKIAELNYYNNTVTPKRYEQTYLRHSGNYDATGVYSANNASGEYVYDIAPMSRVEVETHQFINTAPSTDVYRITYNVTATGGMIGAFFYNFIESSQNAAVNNIYVCNGSSITLTLPSRDSDLGERIEVKNVGSDAVTLDPDLGNIDGTSTYSVQAGEYVKLLRVTLGSNYWITL